MMLRADCPHCAVSYPLGILGVPDPKADQRITVQCLACGKPFEATVMAITTITTTSPPWWRVWDRAPRATAVESLTVQSRPR